MNIIHVKIIRRLGVADQIQLIRRKSEFIEVFGCDPFPNDCAASSTCGDCRKFRVRAITMEKKETSYGETEATGYFRRAA